MKVGRLYLPAGNYHPSERSVISIDPDARADESNPLTSYLLYEVPIRTPQFAGFIITPDIIKGVKFDSVVFDATTVLDQTKLGTADAILQGTTVFDPPPMEYRELVKNAAKDLPTMVAGEVPFKGLADVWVNQPEIYNKFIDQRKDPGSITRQNSFIIMAWAVWEEQKLTLKERIAGMKAQGFGELEPKNLEKRAKRMGLSIKKAKRRP